jgi:hypothetical protein
MNETRPSKRALQAALAAIALGSHLMAPWAQATEAASKAFTDGWRQAKVVSLLEGGAQAPGHIHQDCRSTKSSEPTTSSRHVLASYSFGGNPNQRRHIVVPLADAHSVKTGDVIRVNVRECLPAAR